VGREKLPPGKTLVEGRFHYQACVVAAVASVAKICDETAYELEGIVRHATRSPQPGAIRSELEQEARESAVTLGKAITAVRATA
jgi:hypothetical protein